MRKFRFIAEEDLLLVARALDGIVDEFPVAKIPELNKQYQLASEALSRTFDAQDRGLFLSTLQSLAETVGRMGDAIVALEGRATLAQKIAGPVATFPEAPRPFVGGAPRPEPRPSIPGEEAVVLNFDDFGGGVE